MKVQINEESARKFTREYFDTHKIVKQTYDYKYSAGKNQMMHITFNIDVNFFMPTGVTITSILENNKDLDFTFHIFTNEVNEENLKRLKQTAEKYKQNCIVYVLDIEPFSHFHIKHDRFKRVSYFRLYVPKILKNLTEKFLYIDADLICINSIKPFMKIDLGDKILAAVADLPQACQVKSTHLGLLSGKYFNSGVLWIDAKIDSVFPGYKETISSGASRAYNSVKNLIVSTYLDITSSICESNASLCAQAKEDFQNLKTSFGLTWEFLKDLASSGLDKLKNWYEIWSGK